MHFRQMRPTGPRCLWRQGCVGVLHGQEHPAGCNCEICRMERGEDIGSLVLYEEDPRSRSSILRGVFLLLAMVLVGYCGKTLPECRGRRWVYGASVQPSPQQHPSWTGSGPKDRGMSPHPVECMTARKALLECVVVAGIKKDWMASLLQRKLTRCRQTSGTLSRTFKRLPRAALDWLFSRRGCHEKNENLEALGSKRRGASSGCQEEVCGQDHLPPSPPPTTSSSPTCSRCP